MGEMFLNYAYVNVSLWTIVALIMFVGYWTYADYYTNLSKQIREVFAAISIGQFGCGMFFLLIGLGIEDDKMNAVNVGVCVFTAISTVVYSVLLFVFLSKYFEQSRKYFGRKRNKI
ncbi:putative membrane protein [Erwinia phage pEa_SNUABM_50]|uniref:Uncharacterized protein n=4 Tax=Eneladusvirus BF TaxID=2560751 RepID=A0A1S6UBE5_9CAUD|nr:membrane protein [Serratia phage BF]QOI71418.1 putative membrane protein [Erwinia phage pEa_SNUABM_12]QOI72005.1 putative membrane protein [Erwinia phage pEa_SNUABM_47]QOI72545.1 putative membrane protein [Erwinia phage pEa_SNUABM_50]QXO12781.1 hypothetical protein pEaSNUABM49_00568 [Erwinia phage pEa_SNUABM_49]AQW89056.1 hypothetical protein BF_0531 [Serratia phage BF]